ncbi:MAG: SAM-dependent methyltransferase [Lachnospiraceae bacterium]|nr:SAM-dependent methyltransferase [Lachnospiraceae bacterium]MBQ3907136.1 SAM-dependent methyltransferase [Lachnospiraceae bacterium]
MEELRKVLEAALNEGLQQLILSNTRDGAVATKARIRPVMISGELLFQETKYQGTKVFHANFTKEEMIAKIGSDLQNLFKQGDLTHKDFQTTILVSKKGKMTVKTKRVAAKETNAETQTDDAERLSHNRAKVYLLPEGEPVDFLIRLGVQTPDGRITKNRYDKFRQINRYLEFIEDVLDELPKDRTIRIVDFGCGKSYLTFATYYFLHVKQGRDLEVTGLDLKEDVIRHCNEIARDLRYDHLHFEQGDISAYGGSKADVVISLHACDLATDYALEKAVKWGAKVIMAVPCCQHELNRQMKNDTLKPALKYGIIKERMAALLTDAIRAQLLEEQGYDTQILEFIDMEHTPKNLLIRAVKRDKMRSGSAAKGLREMEEFLQVQPTLERLLRKESEE